MQQGRKAAHGLDHTVTSLAIPLSPEMSPSLRVVVYVIGDKDQEVIADSVIIPVRGINRGNVSGTSGTSLFCTLPIDKWSTSQIICDTLYLITVLR